MHPHQHIFDILIFVSCKPSGQINREMGVWLSNVGFLNSIYFAYFILLIYFMKYINDVDILHVPCTW